MLTEWSSHLPDLGLGLLLLYLPGLLCLIGFGVTGFSRWLLAPAWSAGTVLLASLILSALGVGFSLGPVLVVQLVCVLLCALVGLLVHRSTHQVAIPTPDGVGSSRRSAHVLWGSIFGVTVIANAAVMWWRSFGSYAPDAPAQQNDALFHSSGVWSILHSGNASPLGAFSRMYGPEDIAVVYPNVFHQFVALFATTATVIPATKLFLLGICVVWIAGVAGLCSAVLPTVKWAPWVAIVFAQFHPSFPVYLLNRVSIWPNALGIALLPGILAVIIVTVRSLGSRRDHRIKDAVIALLTILPAIAGLVGTYASVYFAMVVVLGGLAVGAAIGLPARRWLPSGRPLRVLVVSLPFVLALFGPLLLSGGLRARFVEWHLPDSGSPVFTVWSLLMQYPAGGGSIPFRVALLAYALANVIGVIRGLRSEALRPVAVAWIAIFLFTVGTVLPLFPLTQVTSVWYYGIYRLVPYTLMLSVPLVVNELILVTTAVLARLRRRIDTGSAGGCVVTVSALVLGMVLASAVADVVRVRDAAALFEPEESAETYMVDDDELAMMKRLEDRLPSDALVIGTPSSGAAYLPSYANVDVVYRQNGFGTALGPDSDGVFLAEEFNDIHSDPEVCRLLEEYNIGYYYADADRVYNKVFQSQRTPGLYDVDTSYGFEEVDSGGGATVFEITACDGELPPALPAVTIDTVPDTDG